MACENSATSEGACCANERGLTPRFTRSHELTHHVLAGIGRCPSLATDRTLAKWLKLLPDLNSGPLDLTGQAAIAIESILLSASTRGGRPDTGLADQLLRSVRRRRRLRTASSLVLLGLLISGVVIVAGVLLVATTVVGVNPRQILALPTPTVQLFAVAGAIGGSMSVLARIPAFGKEWQADRWNMLMVGFGRPIIGAAFASLVCLVLGAGMFQEVKAVDSTSAYFAVVGFLAGFSERYVPDLIQRTEQQFAHASKAATVS